MPYKTSALMGAAAIAFTLAAAHAAPVMPDFATIPTGWTTDRYDPNSFSNIGSFQGRSNVLGIGISNADSLNNRPAAYQYTFYNTQGKGYALNAGAGSVLSADLYIPSAWRDAANGNVRTDIWGVASDASNAVSDYPIIGFTNYGGPARLRVWDENLGGGAGAWVDLATAINFDAWTSLAIDFTGTSFDYFVNNTAVFADNVINGSTEFSAVLMQAYNFGDPSLLNATPVDYVANWSNSQAAVVPEPATLALFGIGLIGLGFGRHKRAS